MIRCLPIEKFEFLNYLLLEMSKVCKKYFTIVFAYEHSLSEYVITSNDSPVINGEVLAIYGTLLLSIAVKCLIG